MTRVGVRARVAEPYDWRDVDWTLRKMRAHKVFAGVDAVDLLTEIDDEGTIDLTMTARPDSITTHR